jgi:hypothetical protein
LIDRAAATIALMSRGRIREALEGLALDARGQRSNERLRYRAGAVRRELHFAARK